MADSWRIHPTGTKISTSTFSPLPAAIPYQVTNHPAHDWQPDWSVKDQIVFRSERDGGGLYVVAPTGGHERRVAEFGHRTAVVT